MVDAKYQHPGGNSMHAAHGTWLAGSVHGLCMETTMSTSSNRTSSAGSDTVSGPVDVNPGDQAPPGSPQSGERICPRCGGEGRHASGERCDYCGGTGRVIELVGDA
jgi:hypothetical protein